MNNAMLYREAMTSLTPTADWRGRTLAAMTAAEVEPVRRHLPLRPLIAVAASLALLVGGFGAYRQFYFYAPITFPGGIASTGPGYSAAATLPKITLSTASDMGMGGYGDDMGTMVVRDPAEQRTQNPTLDNADGITHLPVYKNPTATEEEQLARAREVAAALGTEITAYERSTNSGYPFFTAYCADGTDIWLMNLNECYVQRPPSLALPKAAITLDKAAPHLWSQLSPLYPLASPTLQATTSYDFYGRPSQQFFWFEGDMEKSLTDQLLDYSFARVGATSWSPNYPEMSTFRLPCWPVSEGTLYPLRTAAQAEADFRAGNYLGADLPTDLASATILYTELVYFNQPYQAYIQPMYRITYTQDYWDTTPVMERFQQDYKDGVWVDPSVEIGVDPNLDPTQFTSVSYAYIPAVTDEYVDMTDAQLYFNY